MDEQYPIVVEGDWRPEHAKSVKNKLQIYFQSKKKSRGGDCVVKYNDETSNSATILFKSSDIRDAVLTQAEHVITIDSQHIKLKLSKPSNEKEKGESPGQQTSQACEIQKPNQSAPKTELDVKKPEVSNSVVLENLADHFNEDILTLLVENVSGLSENDFSINILPELRKAVVTFTNSSAAGEFLEVSRLHEKFKKNNLRVQVLERSTSVRLENLPAEANEMLLELYFEKWGGPIEEIITIPSEQAAIITFKEEEAKERVLKNENIICNVPVKIYSYIKSLDMICYGGNRQYLKLPDTIAVRVHPTIMKFLLKTGQISSLIDQMRPHFCQLNMDKPDVLLIPDPALLKQKGITRRHIDGWSKNALDNFKKIISDYTTSEWSVSHVLWSKVETDVKSVVKDRVYTEIDASKGVLTLAGMSHEIFGLKPIMEKIFERAVNQMDREKNSVTENIEMSPAMYSLLEKDGLKSAVSPHLHSDYSKNISKLVISGLQTECLKFKNWVLEKKINMKQRPLKIDRSILEFLRSVDCDEMSTNLLISHGINAVYTIENGDVVVTGSTEKALAEAEERISTVLKSKDLLVEDQSVLQLPGWLNLKKELQESFNTSNKRTITINLSQGDKVIVTGFKEPVMEVSENLGHFIEKHSRIEETVRVKSHAAVEFIKYKKSQDWQHLIKSDGVKVYFDSKRPRINVSGQRTFVQPAVAFLISLSESLYTDTLTIKKAGAKKYFKEKGKTMLSFLKEEKFVVVLQEDEMLEEEGDFTTGRFEDFGQVSCEVRIPGGVLVTVRKADICTLNVDAVVNAANEDLKHGGGVAFSLLQAAGPRLQEICDRYIKANGSLNPGDAIITDACRLPCKYVVHAVGPRFRASDRRNTERCLRHAVKESLNQASSKNCSSIAIPVISSGIFGCPLDLCTESIAKEVRQYIMDQSHRNSSCTLTEIHLVDNNGKNVDAMSQAVRKEFAAYDPKMTFPHQSKSYGYNNNEHGNRGVGSGHGRGHENNNQRYHTFEVPKGRGNRDFKEETYLSSGGRFGNSEGLSVLETKTTNEGLNICLCEGNIQDARADAIVNTISEDKDLRKGAVSKALLQAAGHQLQSEINQSVKSYNLGFGEIVITDGYNLKCRKVFHVVCPFWRQGSEDRVLIQIIINCLKNAETQGMTSIVFPAIGTGNLGFPKDLVAKIMLTEVQQFNSTNLRNVTVVVHPSDKESVQCFTSVFRHGIHSVITKRAHQNPMPKINNSGNSAQTSGLPNKFGVHTMQLGRLTLEVSSGDITKEKTDAIVNSSDQSFSLKTGVSKAILDAAGVQVERECSKIVASSDKQLREIVTSSGRLPCENIIHITGCNSTSLIKDVVFSVLKLCESRRFTSVAFPALGTGLGGAKPSDVADAMVDAVLDFVKKKKPEHVKCVKFLIFQATMVTDFHQSMAKRSGEKVEEEKGLFTKIKDYLLGESSESSANEFFVKVEEIEPAVFQLCGESPRDLREAKEMINNLIMQDYLTIPIHDPAIALFTREEVEILNTLQKELTIRVNLEKKGQDSVIKLEGLIKDVNTADRRIQDMIRKVERNESRRREAVIIRSLVEWQYRKNGFNFKNFDMLTNSDLEKAFQSQQPTMRITIDNDEYMADLVNKEARRGKTRIEIKRVDVQAAAAEAAAQTSLPSVWEDMKGKSFVLVKLAASSAEFAEVEKEFRRTGLTLGIIEIERVQNSSLWKNYMIKKEELEGKNKHKNNEMRLFHGTGPGTTDKINSNGFNRSFAGTHGAMYGNGTYFAVDPNYSAKGYSKPDSKGHKRMYLAKVLIGDYTQGHAGLLVPPAKSSNSPDLYDSVTDKMNSPSMFVIFNDVQAYPEYLITFQ